MTEVLAPVDVEAAVAEFLPDPVGTRLTNPLGEKFTRITRAGGERRNLILGTSRVLIECLAAEDTDAWDLAREAWGRLGAAAQSYLAPGVWVTRVELTDPVNFPDPESKSARYQFVASLTLSLTPLEIS
jgi:hypothetical protein